MLGVVGGSVLAPHPFADELRGFPGLDLGAVADVAVLGVAVPHRGAAGVLALGFNRNHPGLKGDQILPQKTGQRQGVMQHEQGEFIAPSRHTLNYGDWCHQGYPYLAAMVDYSQHITLPEGFMGQRLVLSADVGNDLFEVYINGEHAGTRMWQPYELDITPYVKETSFTLTIRVVNTIANLLEAKGDPSGLNALYITPYPVYSLR